MPAAARTSQTVHTAVNVPPQSPTHSLPPPTRSAHSPSAVPRPAPAPARRPVPCVPRHSPSSSVRLFPVPLGARPAGRPSQSPGEALPLARGVIRLLSCVGSCFKTCRPAPEGHSGGGSEPGRAGPRGGQHEAVGLWCEGGVAVALCWCCAAVLLLLLLPGSPGLTALLSLHPQGSCAALSPCPARSASAPIAPRATSSSTWRTFTCPAMSSTLSVASVAINSRASGTCTSTSTAPTTYAAARRFRLP